jgi:uracil-DNA glycosylase family 4
MTMQGEPNCEACPLREKSRRFVPVLMPTVTPNGLVLVSDYVGPEEGKAGRPFAGGAGTFLRSIFKTNGLDWNATTVLNAINCYAGEWPTSTTAKDKLVAAAREACRPYVLEAVRRAAPKVILAAGGEALRSLTADTSVGVPTHRGTVMHWGGDVLMTGTHNPAGILRGLGFDASVLNRDVSKVARWLAGGLVPWTESWQAAPKPDELARVLMAPMLAVDVETIPEPRNRWLTPLRTIGVGTAAHAVSVPYAEWQTYYTEAEWLEVRHLLRSAFARLPVVMHHAQFDMAVLASHGFEVQGLVDDTMVAHHVLYPRGVFHDLGYAAAMFLDVPAWKSEFAEEWRAPFEALARYNSRDVLVTARLWSALEALLHQRELWVAYTFERENARAALEMSRVGLWVDRHGCARALEQYQREAAELASRTLEALHVEERTTEMVEAARSIAHLEEVHVTDIEDSLIPDVADLLVCCQAIRRSTLDREKRKRLDRSIARLEELSKELTPFPLGSPEARERCNKACTAVRTAARQAREAASLLPLVNIASDQQMGDVLHSADWCALPPYAERTATGDWQTNEQALYPYKRHPVVEPWQAWKSAQHHVAALEGFPVSADGRIHQSYKTHTTPTGRYASGSERRGEVDPLERFNAQNLEPDLLYLFQPPPGRVYIGGDFSQIELRVAAVISGDAVMLGMLNDFDEGRSAHDLHTSMAMRFWPEEWDMASEAERKSLRTIAKRANFGSVYGAHATTLSLVMKSMREPESGVAAQRVMDKQLLARCEDTLASLRRTWVELFHFLESGYRRALKDGRLKIGYITGRWVYFPLRDDEHIRREACYNYPVQCTARERVQLAVMSLRRRLPSRALLCADVHDAVIAEVDDDLGLIEDVRAIMLEEMSGMMSGPGGSVRILTDIKVGRSLKAVK